jgi:multiphosphoryl transfer protein
MVGLVLVCHSARLAGGAAELAAQMGGAELRIAVAGGLDEPGDRLGTDAARVVRAIEEVWSEDGVLVLMDLGSAVLSAEMAVDLLPEERRAQVMLTAAPFVEGAVAAAVAAGLGAPLAAVAEEARGALTAKAAHLSEPADRLAAVTQRAPSATASVPAAAAAAPSGSPAAQLELRLTIANRLGLHARPAAALVRTAARFDAEVTVTDMTSDRGPVSARSLNGVGTLGVLRGDEIMVRASGRQAHEALDAIAGLAARGFGEPPEGEPPASAPQEAGAPAPRAVPGALSPGTVITALPASPGTALGEARLPVAAPVAIPDAPSRDRDADLSALDVALAETGADVRRARESLGGRATDYDAAIFDAHLLLLEDEALLGPARSGITGEGKNVARAWADAVAAAAAAWEALSDPYQRARGRDVRSVGDQVLRRLVCVPDARLPVEPGVLVLPELTPAVAVTLDPSIVRGIACVSGGVTSHGAIIARSLGIPAVAGAGEPLLGVTEGTPLLLDGDAGTLTVAPSPETVRAAEARLARRAAELTGARARALLPAVTPEGLIIRVEANIAGPADVPAALAAGADGVGLLRTEFLFAGADHLPDEAEQEHAYRAIIGGLSGRPLALRTLDAGADKPLAYLPLAPERNPFLGVRGLRLGLSRPDLLATQVRAALCAAAGRPLRIMFPMVTTIDEFVRARAIVDAAATALDAAGAAGSALEAAESAVSLPPASRVAVGIMVEVPAVALMAEAFAARVDFFSIGTNDLAQYVLAAERGNPRVAELGDALHPAVLRLVDLTARAAAKAGKDVAVCGEIAGDPLAIPLLIGLGITELSMAPIRIPLAKDAVRAAGAGAARRLAAAALAAESSAEVRRLCAQGD